MMWAVAGILAFAATVLIHSLLCRLPFSGNRVVSALGVGTLGGLALMVELTSRYGMRMQTWASVFLYAFACEFYIFVFTFVGSSISAGLLLSLRHESLTEKGVDAACSSPRMVERRLEDLVRAGLLVAGRDGYIPTRRARLMLAAFEMLRRFFHRERHREQEWSSSGSVLS